MYLENFVEIISGKLINTPKISFLNKVVVNVSRIQNGDIYIAKDTTFINEAISRGAYAIVTQTDIKIIDEEIAWILVDNLDNALVRFIRYVKLLNNIEIYNMDLVSFNLARVLIKNRQIAFVNNIYELIESLFFKIIFVSFDIKLLDSISIESKLDLLFKINRQTLFEHIIDYDNNIYELTFPSFLITYINNIIYFCEKRKISLDLSNIDNKFMPLFINSFGGIVCYGKSMRFIYSSNNNDYLLAYIKFISNAYWGRGVLLTRYDIKTTIETNIYNSKKELINYFKDSKYHFFIVNNLEQEALLEILNNIIRVPSLF